MKRKSKITKNFLEDIEFCEMKLCVPTIRKSMNCKCGRKNLIKWFKNTIEKEYDGKIFYFWTLCLDRYVFQKGELHQFNLKNSKRFINRALKKLDLKGFRAIGFLDIQQREYVGFPSKRSAEWLCHYHFLVISEEDLDTLDKKLKKAFPSNRDGRSPSWLVLPDRLPFDYSYFIKQIFDMKRKLKFHKDWTVPPKLRKKGYDIQGSAKSELNLYFSNTELLSTIYLIGYRRCSDRLILT